MAKLCYVAGTRLSAEDGHSYMSRLIYGWVKYPSDDQQALNFTTAASYLKHTINGDFNLSAVSEVENLMKGDGSGRAKPIKKTE